LGTAPIKDYVNKISALIMVDYGTGAIGDMGCHSGSSFMF
jgi:hypothetical protein